MKVLYIHREEIWILRKQSVDWIHLPQDRIHWWDLVTTVMNLYIPYKAGNFLISCATISFSKGLCYTE